jgi:protein-S-isoprenylcysteine O-methyltransferase Ste14
MQNAEPMYSDPLFRYCSYAWALFSAGWLIAALNTKPVARALSLRVRLVQRIVLFLAYFLVFLPQFRVGFLGKHVFPPYRPAGYAGFALTLAGLAFAWWARVYLGRNWSSIPMVREAHELIRTGPYSIVRHPIYTGLLLALLGTAIALGEIRGFLGFILMLIELKIRSSVEEKFMTEEFPRDYPQYKQKVKALVPYLW